MTQLKREKYLSRIRPFYNDAGMIKVLTGMRRCGKSVIMGQIRDEILASGVPERNIAYIDLDTPMNLDIRTSQALRDLIESALSGVEGPRYLFIDEVQEADGFERVVNAYRNAGVSVFITGSNSYLLSGELVTKLTGRYLEFMIMPFSFREMEDYRALNGIGTDPHKDVINYQIYGGMPKRFDYPDDASQERYVNSVLEETKAKDILQIVPVRNRHLLDLLIRFMASVPGAEISTSSVSKYLASEGMDVSPSTLQRYLNLIFASKLAIKCERYDVIGKKALKTLYKSYLTDLALHTFFTGKKDRLDQGMLLENLVHNELLSRGYSVFVGKKGPYEIDFVAFDGLRKAYVQVAYRIDDEEVLERELRPLLALKDNHPKFIITMNPISPVFEGVKILDVVDDLLMSDEPLF